MRRTVKLGILTQLEEEIHVCRVQALLCPVQAEVLVDDIMQ